MWFSHIQQNWVEF